MLRHVNHVCSCAEGLNLGLLHKHPKRHSEGTYVGLLPEALPLPVLLACAPSMQPRPNTEGPSGPAIPSRRCICGMLAFGRKLGGFAMGDVTVSNATSNFGCMAAPPAYGLSQIHQGPTVSENTCTLAFVRGGLFATRPHCKTVSLLPPPGLARKNESMLPISHCCPIN